MCRAYAPCIHTIRQYILYAFSHTGLIRAGRHKRYPTPMLAELQLSRAVAPGSAVAHTNSGYIALRSALLPFRVLSVQHTFDIAHGNILIVNPAEFGTLAPSHVEWEPVTPPVLSFALLRCTREQIKAFKENDALLFGNGARLLRAGARDEISGAEVIACEPCDEGILTKNTAVSLVLQKDTQKTSSSTSVDAMRLLSVADSVNSVKLEVRSLRSPMDLSCLRPAASLSADSESMVFAHATVLVQLGVFSGDYITVNLESDPGKQRVVQLYAHPQTSSKHHIYMSPLLRINIGCTEAGTKLVLNKIDRPPVVETAKEITLARVSTPESTFKPNMNCFLEELKRYFTSGPVRLLQNGDLVAVGIDTVQCELLATADARLVETVLSSQTARRNAVVWFSIKNLPPGLHAVSPTATRMVQSGIVQQRLPTGKIRDLKQYLKVETDFSYAGCAEGDFGYADRLRRLLMARKGAPSVLLTSSRRGVGKVTLVKSLAEELGLPLMVLSAEDLIGDSDAKTLASLTARLERAAETKLCVVCIKHIECLSVQDAPLTNGFLDILEKFVGLQTLICTVNDVDSVSDSVRARFSFEIEVGVPSERERLAIVEYLFSKDAMFALQQDVRLAEVARQSAGLTPLDLCAIVKSAQRRALASATRDTILCSRGKVRVTSSQVSECISAARGKFSDMIGAPRIPNVQWKDVGGLETVKGEILDTIEMPLKHPELFANGLKKRSGILFYGPPGTGKTLLAKAIATSFSLNFFSVKGPELLNMYIGESEANVRRVFQKARDAKPCVIFFDELDSVAPKRGNKGDSGGVMDRIVSQLLAELDGMNASANGVFCIGATNRPDLLDEALLRPGRFDKLLYLGISDTHEKQLNILKALTRKFKLSADVDLAKVAEGCPLTYTGADFYALSSDAMLNAMTRAAVETDAAIAEHNKAHPENQMTVRKWFQSNPVKLVEVQQRDFEKACAQLTPSVSADELEHYLAVRRSFEGGQ